MKEIINTITVIIIAIIFIMIAGIFLYKHENADILDKNPIYFALGIAFAGGGSSIIFNLLQKNILPSHLRDRINLIKK